MRDEALRRPERWRPALRRAISGAPDQISVAAAALLDQIGEQQDVAPLRSFARRGKANIGVALLGRGLARRLAPRVWIEDLGHLEVLVGSRVVIGADIRRKVLALLCYLVTKPGLRAQREEVLDALWPDLEPGSALNSLNQTAYFLRRVFEPDYDEDVSPGYVQQSAEFIWLDSELVTARSQRCREQIRLAVRSGNSADVLAVARDYRGRFALDFLYEDWASPYRDGLHGAYLQLVESTLRGDIDGGEFTRGIQLAQAATEVEPEAEELHLALIKLYRLSGAHAAAAEEYGRYAAILRDIGVEAPRFEEV